MRYRIPADPRRKAVRKRAQCCAHCRAQSVCKLCAMPRTIRRSSVAQSVRSVAHGSQLFCRAVCVQCCARSATLPSCNLCAVSRTSCALPLRNAAHTVAHKPGTNRAHCRARSAALPLRSLCAMSRTVRNSSIAQSMRKVAHGSQLFCRVIRSQCRAQLAAQCSVSSRTIGCNGISPTPGVVRTATSCETAAKRKTASGAFE